MTTSIGERGELVIPKVIRTSRKIQPGDNFEVITDEDDLDLILLRRIRQTANAGLLKHLTARPNKVQRLRAPPRRPEAMSAPEM